MAFCGGALGLCGLLFYRSLNDPREAFLTSTHMDANRGAFTMNKSTNTAAQSKKATTSTKCKKLSRAGQALINHGITERLKEMRTKDVITQEDYKIALSQYKFTTTSKKIYSKHIDNVKEYVQKVCEATDMSKEAVITDLVLTGMKAKPLQLIFSED